MNSRIPPRPISTPSPLTATSLDSGPFSERGLLERNSGLLRSSGGLTPPKSRTEGEIEKVKVFARIRPALRDDETPGALVWSEDGGHLTIFRPDAPVPQSDFTFDKVLGPGASQADVYTAAVSDVVADVLRGYNGTILAYGQTGAGKTYTLGNTAPDAIGMIPRAAAELFSAAARDALSMYRITMSYIQIYMEMIQDLLNPTADNLPIREDGSGVFVAGACEVPVTSLEECLHYLELGEQNRVFAFTHLNAHSSRSHAVVMLTAVKSRKYLTNEERVQAESPDQDGVVTQKVTVGKLYMVDLAGSERLKKSKSVGLRATEARSINLSLTMLGMCISARAQDSPHVPFRDSKLTRLLQESLGGNAKTSLILCLSDVRQHADESLQSLQFGARASHVCNKPVVNERLQMRQLTAELLAALEEGNERSNGLEAALHQTKEERDALQAALARERARSAAIVEALRAEARTKDEQAAAKLALQAELLSEHELQLGAVQQQQGQLEMEVAKLREERRVREEAHQSEVSELQQRLAEVQAEAAAERMAMEAEARSQQARLAAAAQQQAAALSSQLAAERAAAREQAASIHLALTRLQRALGELVAGPPPTVEDGGAGAGPAAKRRSGGGRSSDGGGDGGLVSRPSWMAADLAAAAAAAAASRRGRSSSSGGGGSGGGGSSAVQMIQAALGLTEAPSDADADGNAAAAVASLRSGELERGGAAAGPTAAAIAALVGDGDAGLPGDGTRRLHASQSLGAAAGPVEGRSGTAAAILAAANLRTAHSATTVQLPAAASGPLATARQQQQQQNLHGQRQQHATSASSGVDGGGSHAGGGGGKRSGSGSHALASSEIADIDAALAAAQQDLLAELRAAVPGSGSDPASAPPGWPSSGAGRLHGLAWPPAPAAAAAVTASASASGGVGVTGTAHTGQDAAAAATAAPPQLQPSPRGSRSSVSGAAASGSYASEYAAAVANGLTSPGRQYRSYSQLHGNSAAATAVVNGLSAKPPRAYGSGFGAAASDGGSCSGALRDEPSGHSSASVSMPGPPSLGISRGGSTLATPSASNTTDGLSQGLHHLSTPFLEQRGRQAAAAASPSPTSRDMTSAFAGGAAAAHVDLRNCCSSSLNLNPAFDTGDSELLGLKSLEVGLLAGSLPAAAAAAAPPPPSARERRPSDESLPPPALPMFTGIQVQLDALLDMAAALRRVKTGLEARVLAQACELARRQEEQQRLEAQSRADLQASRSALAAAESQLAITAQELDAVRLVLAETVDELGRTRRELDERSAELDEHRQRLDDAAGLYDSALMRMGETRGRLDEALSELEARRGDVARLEQQLHATKADLASERAALARSLAASARSQAVTTQALAARHELQRQVRAANTIKRAFKAFKLAQLRGQVAAKHRELREAEATRREREALQAARAGQALVQESVGLIRDAVGSILTAFVGRRHQLEARKVLQDRMDRMMSQGGGGSAGGGFSSGGGAGGGAGASKSFGGAAVAKLPLPPLAGQTTTSAGGARSAAAVQPPPSTPGRGRRQMSSPLSVMLSAVTLPPPQTPAASASASTAASTGRPTGSAGGGRPQRSPFPPTPLQLPDDAMTTASSGTPRQTAGGSVGGGAGVAVRSSGGGGGGAATSAVHHGPWVSGFGGDSGEVRSGGGAEEGRGGAAFRVAGPAGGGAAAAASTGGVRADGGGGGAAHARLISASGSNAGGGSAAMATALAIVNVGNPGNVPDVGPCSSSSSCSGVAAVAHGASADATAAVPAGAAGASQPSKAAAGGIDAVSSPSGRTAVDPAPAAAAAAAPAPAATAVMEGP